MNLTDNLVKMGYLKTPRLIKAFEAVNRADFLPASYGGFPGGLEKLAKEDEALPIGYGQTISQPAVVAFMLELLQPRPGDVVLDVGSGSGWTAALLSHVVGAGKKGKVYAIETVPELKNFGETNVLKYNFAKKGTARFILGDGSLGYDRGAPFDRILASAAGKEMPDAWVNQLRTGGLIVAPIGNSIWRVKKKKKGILEKRECPGFIFVPLVTD
jgi:protein-L-isoaspartate(D-aspartate) O-methyltransferase